MKRFFTTFAATTAMLISGLATASGELFIYNWTEYTPPELIEKFEKETGIKVSVDTYDSNETLLMIRRTWARAPPDTILSCPVRTSCRL